MINGVKSATSDVLSGVPQGSVIGPLLFSIYVNDLPSVVSSQVLFADDVKLFCPIVNQQSNFQLSIGTRSLITKRVVNKLLLNFNIVKTFNCYASG